MRCWNVSSFALLIGLVACSGGGSAVPQTPSPANPAPVAMPSNASATAVQFSITFPAQSPGGTAAWRRQYVSPSIESLKISIDGGAPTFVNAPTPTGSPQTVTTTIGVSPGNHAFALGEYDKANGAGNLLGSVDQNATVIAGQLNKLSFTLNGNLAHIEIQAPDSPFVEGSVANGFTLVGCAPQTFDAVPQDADGNTIVMPGLIPKISASAGSSSVRVAAGSSNQFTLEAPSPASSVAITASGKNLAGAAVDTVFDVKSAGAFYVADFTAQKIRAFDESGTPLTLAASAFAPISNPMGLTATPCTSTAGGTLFVTETADGGYPWVTAFDLGGTRVSLPSGAFSFDPGIYDNPEPLLLTNYAGTLYLPDEYSSQLSEFTVTGTALALAKGAFPNLKQPSAVAYDPHDNEIYVTDEGTSTLNAYKADGTYIGDVTTNSHPFGVVYDPDQQALYVASGGTTGAALDTTLPSPANVAEYSEGLTAVSNLGGFTQTSTTVYYSGIAFDSNTKELYVSDSGSSAIVAYGETGSKVTLASGAFSTISAGTTPPSDPIGIVFVP